MKPVAVLSLGMSHTGLVNGVDFDPKAKLDQVDAVFWWYTPYPELLNCGKPIFWYQCEGITRSFYRTRLYKRLTRDPRITFLHHHPSLYGEMVDPITHYEPWCAEEPVRRQGIGALASNFGGRIHWFREERFRNRFNMHPKVSLYGPTASWGNWRRWPWSNPNLPSNYCGEVSVSWFKRDVVEFLAQFDAVISLENALSENYFSERFINTVRAGAIPIYRAHESVRKNYLQGARWIDPADYAFDVNRTLEAALKADRHAMSEQNRSWLLTGAPAKRTLEIRIIEQIADAIRRRLRS
jgi:hypothetical protein